MQVEILDKEVEDILQDDSYDSVWVVTRFNDALNLIATKCRIPGLLATATVAAVANSSSAAMPTNFLHDLFLVTTGTYSTGVTIVPNLKELIRRSVFLYDYETNLDNEATGPAQIVSVDGDTLNYRPLPEVDENLTLHFYRKPTELTLSSAFPDYVPEILQKEIFKNYALLQAYLQIEDGVTGANPNTQKYGGLAAAGIASLVALYPNAPKGRVEIKRSLNFF